MVTSVNQSVGISKVTADAAIPITTEVTYNLTNITDDISSSFDGRIGDLLQSALKVIW